MRSMKSFLASVGVLIAFATSPASAAVVTHSFAGVVTGVGSPIPGISVTVGTAVTGSFAYDTASVPDFVLGQTAWYTVPAPHGLTVNIGGHALRGDAVNAMVSDNWGGNVQDHLVLGSSQVSLASQPVASGILELNLASSWNTTDTFTSLKLPVMQGVDGFDAWRYGVLTLSGNNSAVIEFSVDSIKPVPEPSTWVTLLAGLGALGVLARRRGRQV